VPHRRAAQECQCSQRKARRRPRIANIGIREQPQIAITTSKTGQGLPCKPRELLKTANMRPDSGPGPPAEADHTESLRAVQDHPPRSVSFTPDHQLIDCKKSKENTLTVNSTTDQERKISNTRRLPIGVRGAVGDGASWGNGEWVCMAGIGDHHRHRLSCQHHHRRRQRHHHQCPYTHITVVIVAIIIIYHRPTLRERHTLSEPSTWRFWRHNDTVQHIFLVNLVSCLRRGDFRYTAIPTRRTNTHTHTVLARTS